MYKFILFSHVLSFILCHVVTYPTWQYLPTCYVGYVMMWHRMRGERANLYVQHTTHTQAQGGMREQTCIFSHLLLITKIKSIEVCVWCIVGC